MKLLIILFWLVFSPQEKPAGVRLDEADALRVQASYERITLAQTEFENVLLRAKVKYKIPADWSYNMQTGTFDPPAKPKP